MTGKEEVQPAKGDWRDFDYSETFPPLQMSSCFTDHESTIMESHSKTYDFKGGRSKKCVSRGEGVNQINDQKVCFRI